MGQTAQFAQMLKDVMGKTIVTYIISGAVSRREFVRRLSEVNPDVVHLHGCWNIRIAMAERWAVNRGYPVILSPHGGLSPKVIQDKFWKKRIPQIIAYQFLTIKNADVLHAASAQELKDIKELGWKKRIALIPYSESPNDHQILRDSFHALYQKIIDTASRNRLHVYESEAMWLMLYAASMGRHESIALSEEEQEHLKLLTSHNWKAIQVYAIDHRFRDMLQAGAEALSLTMPVNITEAPPRYTIKPSFHTGTVQAKERKVTEQFSARMEELSIAQNIYILYRSLYHYELREGQPAPIEMVCRINEQIKTMDYDEDMMLKIVDALGIRKFTARLMQILSETMRLTIGYMPLDPLDDNQTEQMRKKLNNLI